jgi:hypothetical protein
MKKKKYKGHRISWDCLVNCVDGTGAYLPAYFPLTINILVSSIKNHLSFPHIPDFSFTQPSSLYTQSPTIYSYRYRFFLLQIQFWVPCRLFFVSFFSNSCNFCVDIIVLQKLLNTKYTPVNKVASRNQIKL